MKFVLGFTLLALSMLSTGCNKQMDEFVSGITRSKPSLNDLIPFEDDGVTSVRVSVGEEKVSSPSYAGQIVIGAPFDQISSSSVSASIAISRTAVE
ncbi:MAG: hypothetical protein ACK5P7_08460 [Bdellovibrio sp.]|jgi:hypothetical protein